MDRDERSFHLDVSSQREVLQFQANVKVPLTLVGQ